MIEVSEGCAHVELGEGVIATCRISEQITAPEEKGLKTSSSAAKPDLTSLGSMLQARWKSGAPADEAKPELLRAGQIRKFRITKLDATNKTIELGLE